MNRERERKRKNSQVKITVAKNALFSDDDDVH
jgi:hypothetical protein